jgi:hypothetical protein
MSGTNQQKEWVQRVLQVTLAPSGATVGDGTGAAPGATLQIWSEAKEKVDTQLNALYDVLRKTGIPVLGVIADEIENVMSNYRVALTKALFDFDSAGPGTKEAARGRVLKAISAYKTSLPANKHIIAADTNPFKMPVTARKTLGAALDKLSQQLGAS